MSFLSQLTKIVNTSQARCVVLHGNIHDLFNDNGKYVPIMDMIQSRCKLESSGSQKGITQVVLRVNSPIEINNLAHLGDLAVAWGNFTKDKTPLEERFLETQDNSVMALELLRQLTLVSRKSKLKNNLLILIEGADLLMPETEISRMSPHDRKRVAIFQNWFGDPEFMNGHDSVVLLADSRNDISHRVSRLPQLLSVEVSLPTLEHREEFIRSFFGKSAPGDAVNLGVQTSGLSLHALRQLLCSGDFSVKNVASKVEEYMISQLGEGVVEFKRPSHTLNDVIGFAKLKKFFREELIPGFKGANGQSISGVLVAGPIGGGKTFLCEAAVSELEMPVIVLKNLRSKWYGETDQIFEKLRQILESFTKIAIFLDEADAMLGAIDSDQDTERRLTAKIQQMMSDPRLKGRVMWMLMTARVHRLSPDIRRPGRMDMIIPVLDPEDEDKEEFLKWTLGELFQPGEKATVRELSSGWPAATYAIVRSLIKAKAPKTIKEALDIIGDIALPDIDDTRLYQTLQAKMNCTRKSLVMYGNEPFQESTYQTCRRSWKEKIAELESLGVR